MDSMQCLQKIDNISWHFIDCGVVKLLDVIECTSIVIRNEVNCYSLATESSTASNSICPGKIKEKKIEMN